MDECFFNVYIRYTESILKIIYRTILYTICPKRSYPFYIVTYYIKWATTSWPYSTYKLKLNLISCLYLFIFLSLYSESYLDRYIHLVLYVSILNCSSN